MLEREMDTAARPCRIAAAKPAADDGLLRGIALALGPGLAFWAALIGFLSSR